jgi:gliding motility-associated-like protein
MLYKRIKIAAFLSAAGLFFPAAAQGQCVSPLYPVPTKGFPPDASPALVAGDAGARWRLTSSDATVTPEVACTLTWAQVTTGENNRLEILITGTNATPADREGFIYFSRQGVCRDSIRLVQPGRLYTTGVNNAEGKRFWYAYLENQTTPASVDDGNSLLAFYAVAARRPATGVTTVTGAGIVAPFTAATGTAPYQTSPSHLQAYHTDGGQILQKSIAVETGESIMLYALNRQQLPVDITGILPVEALGDEYIVASYNEPSQGNTGPDMFLIIAAEDGTLVSVEPSVETTAGEAAGVPFTIALNKGETYLVKAQTDSSDGASIHGSYLKATKPVAVFAGNGQAVVGCDPEQQPSGSEHLFEQLTPLRLWGTRYIMAPTGQGWDAYRITAAQDSTLVVAGSYVYSLHRGNYITAYVNGQSRPAMVIADKKVGVTLFGQTAGCNNEEGAPLMMRLNPADHMVREASFVVPGNETGISELPRIIIFAEQGTQGQTQLTHLPSGNKIPLSFEEIPNSDYVFSRVEVEPAVYRLENSGGFTAYVSGKGSHTAYGYPVAAWYSDVPPPPFRELTCFVGQPATLPQSGDNATYHWYASMDDEAELSPSAIDMTTPQEMVLYASQKQDGNESPRIAVPVSVKSINRLYDYDTLVTGVAGSGMVLSSIAAGFTAHTVTDNMSQWAAVTADNSGKITITVTETNNTVTGRIGHIYIRHGNTRDTVVLLQPGKTCENGTDGTEGSSFWVAFSENIYPSWQQPLRTELIATSGRDASCTVTNPRTGWSQSFNINANTVVTVSIPENEAYNTEGEQIAAKALHVRSSVKISLYANNFQLLSSDAANILPVEALGDEYYSLSYNANVAGSGWESGNVATPEEFLIIATEDGTLVTIVPASETGGGRAAGDPYTVRMNRGESYLVKSKLGGAIINESYYASITGSYIKANKLIAVFAGHKRAKISCSGSNSRDHLYEQLFPLRLWGNDYTVPSTGQEYDLYRIVAAYDNTQYTINGVSQPPLQRGKYADHFVHKGTCDVVLSAQPVEVALFTESMNCLGASEGDPFMIALNPIENQIKEITYSPIPSSNISHHYTSILVKRTEKDKTNLSNMITGQPVSLQFEDIPDSDYSCARVEIDAVSHHLENVGGFIAYTYGYGDAESYGYSVGAKFNHIPYPPVPDTVYCVNDTPKPLGDYDINGGFLWYASADDANGSPTPPPFSTATAGTYIFYVSQVVDCSESPRKKVTIIVHPLPEVIIAHLTATAFCEGDSVTLRATNVPTAIAYEWFRNNAPVAGASGSYVAIEQGTYTVKVTDANGCTATSSPQTVTVHPLPSVGITPSAAIAFCEGGAATLHATNVPTADLYEWFQDGQLVGASSSYVVTATGLYTVKVIDINGCTATSSPQTVTVHPLPDVVITPSGATTLCGGDAVTLYADAPAAVSYQWFLDGQPAGSSSNVVATVSGAYVVKVTNANGCTATSSPQTVIVYPLPATPVVTPLGATTFCGSGSVTLTVYAADAVRYEWYKNNQAIANVWTNTCTVSETGNYSVVAVSDYGCRSLQMSEILQVTIYELPETPVIVAHPPFYVGFKYVLEIQSPEEGVRYEWYKDGQYTGNSGLQYLSPALQLGDVLVYFAEAVNAHNCRARSDYFICAAEVPPLFIPNVFTPNNDGINDNFYIAGLEVFVENELQIINKRGQVVYSKKNYYNEWYGGDLPTDTYYYYLTVTDKQGSVSRHTGYVHLKRK